VSELLRFNFLSEEKMFKFWILVLFLNMTVYSQVSVNQVIDEISKDSVKNYVEQLQNFGTRFLLSEKRFEAANWMLEQFEQMGFSDVVLDTFECKTRIGQPYFNRLIDTTTIQVNVIATLKGSLNPDQIAIICGHYDSFSRNSNPFVEAPGADDNASGTTAVLESARAIMKAGFLPNYTIRFIAFAAEELMYFGDGGSRIYADKCKANDENIIMVVNNDMIGYCETNYLEAECNIGHPDNFVNFDRVMSIADQYSAVGFNGDGYHGADLQGFLDNGYTGVYMEEATFNYNNYHMNSDITANVNFNFMTEVIKAATAILISGDEIVTSVTINDTPTEFAVLQNYPNPFNPVTQINYEIKYDSNVKLYVADQLGRIVEILYNGYRNSGFYSTQFNTNYQNKNLASGVYYLILNTNNVVKTRKMMLLK
jgi:hypothetical protein